MKYIPILFLILFLASCSIGPVYVYDYQPVIKITGDTTSVTFTVPDLAPDGWGWGDGADSISFPILLKESKDVSAYVTDIEWYIVTEENPHINDGNVVLLSPLELKKSTSDTMFLNLRLGEDDAYWIDASDGINDNVGEGVIIINVIYYDDMANRYESLPFYLPIKVIKP